MSREIICIVCPLGCKMTVQFEESEVKTVMANQCKKGIRYAQKELTFPGRVLTTTMKTDMDGIPLLPVRSNKEIPLERIMDCMKEISILQISEKVSLGQTIISNILNLGVDIISCRTMK